jgi:hypothetical protein
MALMPAWIEDAETWLLAHIATLELVAVWSFAVMFTIWAIGKLLSWLALRGSHDATAVGHTLKHHKAAEGVAMFAWALYWALVLWAYYDRMSYSIWVRWAVIVAIILAMAGATIRGLYFVAALHRETRWGAGEGGEP